MDGVLRSAENRVLVVYTALEWAKSSTVCLSLVSIFPRDSHRPRGLLLAAIGLLYGFFAQFMHIVPIVRLQRRPTEELQCAAIAVIWTAIPVDLSVANVTDESRPHTHFLDQVPCPRAKALCCNIHCAL